MNDVICPYCGDGHPVEPEDREEDIAHQVECDCGKTFIYYVHITFDYAPYKADCLNGGEHNWVESYSDHRLKIERCKCCNMERITREKK